MRRGASLRVLYGRLPFVYPIFDNIIRENGSNSAQSCPPIITPKGEGGLFAPHTHGYSQVRAQALFVRQQTSGSVRQRGAGRWWDVQGVPMGVQWWVYSRVYTSHTTRVVYTGVLLSYPGGMYGVYYSPTRVYHGCTPLLPRVYHGCTPLS